MQVKMACADWFEHVIWQSVAYYMLSQPGHKWLHMFQVGDEIPPPDDVVDANDFREIWRPIADQHHHAQNDQAHVLAPPGLDPYHVVKSQLEQVSKHFMSVDIPFPLQALQLDQYFYKDPAGNVQVSGRCIPPSTCLCALAVTLCPTLVVQRTHVPLTLCCLQQNQVKIA